ncbi:MAG: hypothetical protein LBU32_25960 [Clostridiales bacterium]|nr:hypothetical protein [Clostridiales bacterium]
MSRRGERFALRADAQGVRPSSAVRLRSLRRVSFSLGRTHAIHLFGYSASSGCPQSHMILMLAGIHSHNKYIKFDLSDNLKTEIMV